MQHGRHDPGQHRRPLDRAAGHVRPAPAGEVQGPGAEDRPQRDRASTSGASRASRRRRPFGMAATVGWPREQWGFNPGAFSELRPGCFDVHERVRDMNANGVLGSMCFPTMTGLQRPHVHRGRRQGPRARHPAGVQRLAHRRVVRRVPGPVHPARHRADVGHRPRGRRGAPPREEGRASRSASSRRRTRRATRASSRATGTRCSRRWSRRTWC